MSIAYKQNKLVYDKSEYTPAVDWSKSFAEGKYAYQLNLNDSIQNTKIVDPLCFGARYFEKNADEDIFVKNNFMADMTVINPGKIGNEFVKTVGHYHQYKPGTGVAYPEVYEAVTSGFEYLLQTEPDEDGKVEVVWVITQAGDKVVMPPGYGHVSMNVGSNQAVEIDIQLRDNPNGSDYSMFKDRVGGAFYRTEDGLVKNPNYEVSSLRIVKPLQRPDWGLIKTISLYDAFVESPEKFEYLINPEKFDFSLDGLFEDIEL